MHQNRQRKGAQPSQTQKYKRCENRNSQAASVRDAQHARVDFGATSKHRGADIDSQSTGARLNDTERRGIKEMGRNHSVAAR